MQENKREKSHIKNRILQFLEINNISRYAFYKDTGISRGTLDQETGISEENLTKFLAYAPEVSLRWLLTGEGEMLESTDKYHASEMRSSIGYGFFPETLDANIADYDTSYSGSTTHDDDPSIHKAVTERLRELFDRKEAYPATIFNSITEMYKGKLIDALAEVERCNERIRELEAELNEQNKR